MVSTLGTEKYCEVIPSMFNQNSYQPCYHSMKPDSQSKENHEFTHYIVLIYARTATDMDTTLHTDL